MNTIQKLSFFSMIIFFSSTLLASEGSKKSNANSVSSIATQAKDINIEPAFMRDTMMAMDNQIGGMKALHQKMMGANTPAARQALMAEQMSTMQASMSMMDNMSQQCSAAAGKQSHQNSGGMMGNGPMPGGMNNGMQNGTSGGMQNGMTGRMRGGVNCDAGLTPREHVRIMEKRMEMMEGMMQMMMDRMDASAPNKPVK